MSKTSEQQKIKSSKASYNKIIDTRWSFEVKSYGRLKARLVAFGWKQRYGINYGITFASVYRLDNQRLLLLIAITSAKWIVFLNVVTDKNELKPINIHFSKHYTNKTYFVLCRASHWANCLAIIRFKSEKIVIYIRWKKKYSGTYWAVEDDTQWFLKVWEYTGNKR